LNVFKFPFPAYFTQRNLLLIYGGPNSNSTL
jgi:hypothetical protein